MSPRRALPDEKNPSVLLVPGITKQYTSKSVGLTIHQAQHEPPYIVGQKNLAQPTKLRSRSLLTYRRPSAVKKTAAKN
jgi:hypothetical protein